MTHFSTEEWIDFVKQMTPTEKRDVMQQHLDGGCKRCAATVELWEKVRETAAAELNYQPPADTMLVVKAAFAGAGFGKQSNPAGVIELIFDSFTQPLFQGARSDTRGPRELLYRADPFLVDVQIEPQPGGKVVAVTGQLFDAKQPENVGNDLPIVLSNRRGHVVNTMTNEFGEFHGQIEGSGDLELSLPSPAGKAIVISMRYMQGPRTEGAQ
jgi:hypothetical protein